MAVFAEFDDAACAGAGVSGRGDFCDWGGAAFFGDGDFSAD